MYTWAYQIFFPGLPVCGFILKTINLGTSLFLPFQFAMMFNHRTILAAITIVVVLLGLCSGQIVLFGSCDKEKVTAKKDFQLSQYVGRWYEQERYFMPAELGLVCVTAEYTMMPDDDSVKVNNTGIRSSTSEAATVIGRAYAPDPTEPGKLNVEFSGGGPVRSLWIVETDYTDYSVAYSCTDMGPYRLVASWLLSRQSKGFSHPSMEAIESALRSNGILKEPFEHVDQTSCPLTLLDPGVMG